MSIPLLLEPALLAAAVLGAPASAGPALAPPAEALALRATKVHIGDGTVLENAVVVLENGKIKSVGGEVPAGARVVEFDGHLSPGLIALRDATGTGAERNESARDLTPTADLSRAFDPDHPDWADVVAEGVTTVVLTPDPGRVAGGNAAIVSPALGEVVRRDALVCLGTSGRAISSGSEPTSYAGLYRLLEGAFADATDDSPLARAAAGQIPVLMDALDRREALLAIDFAKRHGLVGSLVGLRRADEIVGAIKESGLGVVFEPVGPGASPKTLESAVALHEADVPFAFTGDSESRGPVALRMGAAAFVRAGLEPAAALVALTGDAAEIAGVAKTHGTLASGKVADLVVWSGDPIDLTSRVLHVYAGGEHVFESDAEAR